MPINFSCPGCQKGYTVPDQFAGRTSKCRQCGGALQIPAMAAAAPLLADPAVHAAPAAAVPTLAAAPTFAPAYEGAAPAGSAMKKLVIFGSIGFVALFLMGGMAFAAWYFLFSGSSISSYEKYLPNDCVAVVSIRVDDFLASDAWKEAKKELPMIEDGLKEAKEKTGYGPEDISQVFIGIARPEKNKEPGGIAIIKTVKEIDVEDIKSRAKKDHIEFKEEKAGNYTMYTKSDGAFCKVDGKLLILGSIKDVKAVLERDKKPDLSDGLKAAMKKTDFSKTVAFAAALKDQKVSDLMGGKALPAVDKVEAIAGYVNVTSDIKVSLSLECKDDKSAEEFKKLAEGIITSTKLDKDMPKETSEMLDAIKISQSGTDLTAEFQFKASDAIKLVTTIIGVQAKRTFEDVGRQIGK